MSVPTRIINLILTTATNCDLELYRFAKTEISAACRAIEVPYTGTKRVLVNRLHSHAGCDKVNLQLEEQQLVQQIENHQRPVEDDQCSLQVTDYLNTSQEYGPYTLIEKAFEALAPLIEIALREHFDQYIIIDCKGVRYEIASIVSVDGRRLVTFADWFRITPYFEAYRHYEL